MQDENKFVRNLQSVAPPPTSSTEFLPLAHSMKMCSNIHFGITKQKVMVSKLYKLRPQNYKLGVQNLQV